MLEGIGLNEEQRKRVAYLISDSQAAMNDGLLEPSERAWTRYTEQMAELKRLLGSEEEVRRAIKEYDMRLMS